MRLLNNKKALDYAGYLVIITFISLTLLIMILYQKSGISKQIIGEEAQTILELRSESQKINLFIQQAAKYSTLKTINKTNTSQNDFYTYLNQELNEYLALYNETNLTQDNYEFLIVNNTIKGIAIQQIKLEKTIKGQKIEYYFKPSFTVELN